MTHALNAPCDRNLAARDADDAHAAPLRVDATPHPRAVLAATILGSSVAFVDGSVVNVALAALGRDLGASAEALAWAINAYLLPLGALTLLGGALGDRFGRRRFFGVGLAIFTLASLGCAAAPSLAWMIAGRALQGLGAALLLPNSLAILGVSFDDAARGRAIGIWAAAGALAGALGPLVGGALVDTVGWRSIFLLNVPIAAAAGWLAWRYVHEGRGDGPTSRLDGTGAVLATSALCVVTWALTIATGAGARSTMPWIAGLVGIGGLVAFALHERRRGDDALMPTAMFGTATFVGLTLLTFFLYASLGGLIVALPYVLIRAGHVTATAAGAAMIPLPLVIGLASPWIGKLATRIGPRVVLAGGSTVVAAGLALYTRLEMDAMRDVVAVLPATLAVAVGMAACVAPLTTAVMGSVPKDHVGAASGFNSAVARIAGLIATALLGFLFAAPDDAALVAAFHQAAWVAAASALLAAGSALWVKEVRG